MKNIFITFSLFLFINILSFAVTPTWLEGQWITEKASNGNQIIVEFYQKNNLYFGKILKLTIPQYTEGPYIGKDKMDLENPDSNLKKRKLQGLDFVSNFTLDDNKLINGNIYNPENGKIYHCKITKKDNNTLIVKGSIDSMGFIGKTQIWKKITN